MTTLALFGATGKTGRHFLADALDEGYQIQALVRDPAAITQQTPNLHLIEGDALNRDDVRQTLNGANAVVSLLGQAKGADQWLQTKAIQHITSAMNQEGISRIISLTHLGVESPSEDEPGFVDKAMRFSMRLLIPKVYQDGISHAEHLRATDLNWTIVRAPILTDEAKRGYYRIGSIGVNASQKIGRADLATFLLTLFTDEAYHQQLPVVSY